MLATAKLTVAALALSCFRKLYLPWFFFLRICCCFIFQFLLLLLFFCFAISTLFWSLHFSLTVFRFLLHVDSLLFNMLANTPLTGNTLLLLRVVLWELKCNAMPYLPPISTYLHLFPIFRLSYAHWLFSNCCCCFLSYFLLCFLHPVATRFGDFRWRQLTLHVQHITMQALRGCCTYTNTHRIQFVLFVLLNIHTYLHTFTKNCISVLFYFIRRISEFDMLTCHSNWVNMSKAELIFGWFMRIQFYILYIYIHTYSIQYKYKSK